MNFARWLRTDDTASPRLLGCYLLATAMCMVSPYLWFYLVWVGDLIFGSGTYARGVLLFVYFGISALTGVAGVAWAIRNIVRAPDNAWQSYQLWLVFVGGGSSFLYFHTWNHSMLFCC